MDNVMKGFMSTAVEYLDKGAVFLSEAEKKAKCFLEEVINKHLPDDVQEKMRQMTDLIIKAAPHAVVYLAVTNGFMPTICSLYIVSRLYTVLKPGVATFVESGFKGSIKEAFQNAKEAIIENGKKEFEGVMRPAFAVCFLVQGVFALLSLSLVKAAFYGISAVVLGGEQVEKALKETYDKVSR